MGCPGIKDKIDGKYPNPSPATEVAEILKSNIHQELSVSSGDVSERIVAAMLKANAKVREYNREHILDFAAGAVGIVGVIENQRFYYRYIGDCYGRVIARGKPIYLLLVRRGRLQNIRRNIRLMRSGIFL